MVLKKTTTSNLGTLATLKDASHETIRLFTKVPQGVFGEICGTRIRWVEGGCCEF